MSARIRLAVTAAALLAGCATEPPDRQPLYSDPATGPGNPAGFARHWCGHRRHNARLLRAGETLSWDARDVGPSRLVLQACSNLRRREAPADLGALHIRVATREDARAVARAIPLPSRSWWRHQLDLDLPAAGEARVELTFEADPAWELVLKDAYLVRDTVPPAAPARRVLLLSVDTLRSDVFEAIGCDDCRTPNFDRLARDSQRFEPHYAAANWTKPSHASLLTGLLPIAHGASATADAISPDVPLLTELLPKDVRKRGLVRDVKWLDPRWGFARGFDEYRVVDWHAGQAVRSVIDEMLLDDADQFVFLHLFEPHSDSDRLPYEGAGASPLAVEQRFGVARYGCRAGECASRLLGELQDGLPPLPEEAAILRYLYLAGVAETDEAIGLLLDGLEAAGLYETTTILLTSDHGEALLEHGRVGHGRNWETVNRVPLWIKWPGSRHAGEVVTTATSALDVAPTILATLRGPSSRLPGLPLTDGRAAAPVLSGTGETVIWRDGSKLLLDGEAVRLFDLETDPAELVDLAQRRADEARALLDLVRRLRGDAAERAGTPASSELTERELEELRALGYLN